MRVLALLTMLLTIACEAQLGVEIISTPSSPEVAPATPSKKEVMTPEEFVAFYEDLTAKQTTLHAKRALHDTYTIEGYVHDVDEIDDEVCMIVVNTDLNDGWQSRAAFFVPCEVGETLKKGVRVRGTGRFRSNTAGLVSFTDVVLSALEED
jgi:hypothetical protein